ncbi:TPA: phage tail assembly chaperone [Pseudomonas aeruginosa]
MTTIAHIDKSRYVLGIHELELAPAAVLSSNVVVDKAKARQIIEIQNRGKCAQISEDGEVVECHLVSPEVLWEQVRLVRKPLLDEVDYKVNALFDDEKITGVPMDADVLDDLCSYRKALRDITLQADPSNIVWPVRPWL